MNALLQDFTYALRTLRKSPGFAAVAILTLGLGIALNATIFSLVSAWLLNTPAVHDPARVVVVSSVNPEAIYAPDTWGVSPPNYFAWRAASTSFSDMAAASEYDNANITAPGEPEQLTIADVTANYFSVLGIAPIVGRGFAAGEDRAGANNVVILSHQLWAQRFSSDPNVVGTTIRLDNASCTIIGVMPANFRLMGYPMQLWRPIVFSDADQSAGARKNHSLMIVARLAPGVTLPQARAEMAALALRAEHDFPATEKGWHANVRTIEDYLVRSFGVTSAIVISMSAVGFILLIACANIAGLLLARASRRKKEMAIRIALGAGRLRLVRQLLTEGLIIGLSGGAVGLLLAFWGVALLRAAITFNLAVQSIDYRVDANVLGYTLGISLLAALLCSLAPALQSSRTDVNASLKDESRAVAAGRSKLRSVLVTGEVALALMLTCGAALLIFSVVTVASQNPGFVSERVLTANISLDDARYHDPARQFAFYRDVVARLGQLPGVVSAAASFDVPGTGAGSARLHLKGQEAPESMRPTVRDRLGTPDLLKTLQIPLLRGRNFTAQDDGNAPRVVLVDTTFVNRFFNGADPLGKEIGLDVGDSAEPEWAQIIGVVGGTKDFIALEQLEPVVYEAFAQRPRLQMSLLVRTVADPDALAPELRRAVWAVDSQMPVGQVETMRAVLDRVSKGNYIFSDMLATFSLIALLLAGIGIYGVVAYSVAQRTHEIGIRMALGADRVDVMRMVFGESLKLVIIGGAIGLAGASILPRTFDGMLPGFHVHGMWFFAVVPVTIAAIAALATYIPARRALRVDPMVALRYE